MLKNNFTVLSDESLGGVLREYREVKRRGKVGERVKSSVDYPPVFKVTKTDEIEAGSVSGGRDGIPTASHNYVVLEPTDILVINGERLRMVDRKAAVGDRIIVVSIIGGNAGDGRYYRVGNIASVLRVADRGVSADLSQNVYHLDDGKWAVDHVDYRVLEPIESASPLSSRPATEQAAENIAALTAKVTELEARLNAIYEWHKRAAIDLRVAREDIVLIEEGVADDIAELRDRVAALEYAEKFRSVTAAVERAEKSPQKTAQQIRDEIVEWAKADVKGLSETPKVPIENSYGRIGFWPYVEGGGESYMPIDFVEFHVNREKRTVVALIYSDDSGVWLCGIAKCAPNDVFNAHIGRAIALRRALGLEVPAEYLSAPNPTEARLGDVVNSNSFIGIVTLVEKARGGTYNCEDNTLEIATFRRLGGTKIIDDSREGDAVPSSFAQKGAAA